MCQTPPINHLDDSLMYLLECEKLNLSSNKLQTLDSFPKMNQIKILSLGRNQLTSIKGIKTLSNTLEELWVNYNKIESFDGL